MAIDYSGLAYPKGRRLKPGTGERRLTVAAVRQAVFARERGRCRAWVDGHRFAWCLGVARELHEGRTRGAGGAVSTANSVALCRPCHEKRHGVGAWLRITVANADAPDGVTFSCRPPSRPGRSTRPTAPAKPCP